MKQFARLGACAVLAGLCAACAAVFEPYKASTTSLRICSVKREDKLLAIDGQSRLVAGHGINSQGSRDSGMFTGLGGLDKWKYEARFLPEDKQGEEYVVVFDVKGPSPALPEPLTLRFEYQYPKGIEVHYSDKVYRDLPRGRHKYLWKNLGEQNIQNGDIASWRVSLRYRGEEVSSMHSALWRPWGKVVLDQ